MTARVLTMGPGPGRTGYRKVFLQTAGHGSPIFQHRVQELTSAVTWQLVPHIAVLGGFQDGTHKPPLSLLLTASLLVQDILAAHPFM